LFTQITGRAPPRWMAIRKRSMRRGRSGGDFNDTT
jgi:hypothetical protein